MLISNGKPVEYADDPKYAPGPNSCTQCRFGVFKFSGYSSYTVEGRTFVCGAQVHPEDDFDAWYDTDARLNYANQCPRFDAGDPISMGVDLEDYGDLTDEQRAIWHDIGGGIPYGYHD